MRERAAAVLKVAKGETLTSVGASRLLKSHEPETIHGWIKSYLSQGLKGWKIKEGRGRKPAFFPKSVEQAKQELEDVLHRSPRLMGLKRSRWWLEGLTQAVSWLEKCTKAGVWQILKRLKLSYSPYAQGV